MENQTTNSNTYLSFKLGKEIFAAHANKVLSILEMTKVTTVPQAPDYMKGVINLRGTVLPIIDMRIKLGVEVKEESSTTCIIVLDIKLENESIRVGTLVDEVMAVFEVTKDNIMPAPTLGSKFNSNQIDGIANINNDFVMILNVDAVIADESLASIASNSSQSEVKLAG